MIEFVAEIFEVVCFTVVSDPVAGLWIGHWLMTGVGGIDDREPRVAEDYSRRATGNALIVRATVFLRVIHTRNNIAGGWAEI